MKLQRVLEVISAVAESRVRRCAECSAPLAGQHADASNAAIGGGWRAPGALTETEQRESEIALDGPRVRLDREGASWKWLTRDWFGTASSTPSGAQPAADPRLLYTTRRSMLSVKHASPRTGQSSVRSLPPSAPQIYSRFGSHTPE